MYDTDEIIYNDYHEEVFKLLGTTIDDALAMDEDSKWQLIEESEKYIGCRNPDFSMAADDIRDILSHWRVGQRREYEFRQSK